MANGELEIRERTSPEIIRLVESLMESFRTYGHKDTVVEFVERPTEVALSIEMPRVEGAIPIGYNKKQNFFWIGIARSPKIFGPFTNTLLTEGEKLPCVSTQQDEKGLIVRIEPDHPLPRLLEVLEALGWKGKVCLPSQANWDPATAPEFKRAPDGRLETVIPGLGQVKAAISIDKRDIIYGDRNWEDELPIVAQFRFPAHA